MRLAEDRFYNTYPCVIISGKGQPDVATRLFLNKAPRRMHEPHPSARCQSCVFILAPHTPCAPNAHPTQHSMQRSSLPR